LKPITGSSPVMTIEKEIVMAGLDPAILLVDSMPMQ
jgi:hypothetical protein